MSDLYEKIKSGELVVHNFSSLEARFFKLITKDGSVHPSLGKCWEWLGLSKDVRGYGVIRSGKRLIRVHRLSWAIHFGGIDTQMCVLHKCDNRICVNPEHLFVGTRQDNNLDMVLKGRQVKGECNGRSKLNGSQVIWVRELYSKGHKKFGAKPLAKKLGIDSKTLRDIVQRKTWRHL